MSMGTRLSGAFLFVLTLPALAATNYSCDSEDAIKKSIAYAEEQMARHKATAKQRDAALHGVMTRQTELRQWSKEKSSIEILSALVIPEYTALEEEKKPYFDELVSMLGLAANTDPRKNCEMRLRQSELLDKIDPINARQYEAVTRHIENAQ